LKKYFEEVFWPSLCQAGIKKRLLADSWGTNKDNDLFASSQNKNEDIPVERMLIPEGTTGICQPLDGYFFGPFKQFVSHIWTLLR